MAKEFKTIDELVELLESRNVKTDDMTALILKRESYYAIVNGYKDPFLDKNAMQSTPDDVYVSGTTFSNIYDLFLFDRGLRHVTLQYLIVAESILKNAVVYAFCERNRAADAYLERSNYVSAKDMLVPKTYAGNRFEEYGTNMANLMKILNGKLSISKRTRSFVKHYLEGYGTVPLWVLQNDLTFGNIAHFYQLQKRGVQNGACKIVSEVCGRGIRIDPHFLLRAFDVLVGFRNICAHDERLYCAEVKGAHYAEMFEILTKIVSEQESHSFVKNLNTLISRFSGRISNDVLMSVNAEMHIPVMDDHSQNRTPEIQIGDPAI